MKTLLKFLLWIIILALVAFAGYFFLGKSGETRDIYGFVPDDFVYVIESDEPVRDWKNISSSEIWQYLKGVEYFEEVSASADYLDSLLQVNETLVEFVKLGDMLISSHIISSQDYEMLFLVDIRGRNVNKFKQLLKLVFQRLDYKVSLDEYFNIDIYELYDPEENETLYMSILDNILIASYRKDLLKESINQSEKSSILDESDLNIVKDRIGSGGTYTLYFNHQIMDSFLKLYTAQIPEMMQGMEEVLAYSSFGLSLDEDEAVLEGYVKQQDSVASFLNVFKDVGKGKRHTENVLPSETAFISSITFDDFLDLYRRFDTYYGVENAEGHAEFLRSKEKIEKRLKINFEEDFFSWMTDEIATAIIPIDEDYHQYSYYALLHFDNYDKAKEKLDFITRQIKKKTPLKFENKEYRGFEIKYLEMKGFFKLFFKKLFSKIEKPHYTFLDDYVIFSNDTTSLQFLIDQYLLQNVLKEDEAFTEFNDNYNSRASVFTYIHNEYLFDYILNTLDYESKQNLMENRNYLLSFPRVGFQLSPEAGMYETKVLSQFTPLEVEEMEYP
ncbi:MAG: DUF3352 domain-containing protein [Bacteroidota bacterium]